MKNTDETVTNFVEDSELNDLVILLDNAAENVAEKFGVTRFPSSFLVSQSGHINEMWEDVALSHELAMAIEADMGNRITNRHFETGAKP